ncbi:MAG: hypothetical protein EOO27_00630 [Comamonadaceae bacterium]|nr:MAG: hypothetical protein EOO27_00630 [Comamonadaceae bacterium]
MTSSQQQPPKRPSVGPDPTVKGDPKHPPTTQVDQDRAMGGDRGDNASRNLEQNAAVGGVPKGVPGRKNADEDAGED